MDREEIMNNWILLIISVTACLIGGIVKKQYTNKYSDSPVARHFYNMVCSVVAALVLFAWGADLRVSPFTLILAVAFGIITALQQIFNLKAMETGPWSYTSVISSFSTLIPALSGMLFWNENISIMQIFGVILMLASILLSTEFKDGGAKKSIRWMLYCGMTFLTTGFIGVMQKWHQSTEYKEELGGFLVIAFAVSFLYSAVNVVFEKAKGRERAEAKVASVSVIPVVIMLVAGICAAVNNKLNLRLSGELPSVVFFPVVNGGNLVLTTLLAVLLFKERLTKKQWTGLVIGMISVLLLCNYS